MYSVFEEFLKGWGGLRKYLENGKSWGVGGSYVKFPPWWGYGYFLEPHNAQKYLAAVDPSALGDILVRSTPFSSCGTCHSNSNPDEKLKSSFLFGTVHNRTIYVMGSSF